MGSPDLETDRLVMNDDGTLTAYGRWKGRRDGELVQSDEIWARYRVVDGKIVEIWTHRGNYVFLLGPIIGSRAGLLLVMLRVFLWSRTSGKGDLRAEPAVSPEPRQS